MGLTLGLTFSHRFLATFSLPLTPEIARWAQQQAALNERVGGSLAEQFDAAVMKPVLAWIDTFKVVREMLKEYLKAWTARKHYEDKVAKLKVAQMKGKAKPDKVQRNLRKLDAARSEYARSEASAVRDTRAFFTKCHNNFISVTAMFARFHERLGREFNNEWQANGPWAVQILRMKEDELPVPAAAAEQGGHSNSVGHDGGGSGGRDGNGGRTGSNAGSEGRESSGSFGGTGSQSNGRGGGGGGGGGRDSQMSSYSSGAESGRSSFASSPPAASNNSDNNGNAGDAWGAGAADTSNGMGAADDGFGDWGGGNGAAGNSGGGNDDGFGDWGDMGAASASTQPQQQQEVAPGRPRRKSSPTPVENDGGFGAFGDFGGSEDGGFAAAPAALAPLPSRPSRKSSPSTSSADDGFGAFGDFAGMQTAVPPAGPAPLPPQPAAGEGQQPQPQSPGQRRNSNPFLDFF